MYEYTVQQAIELAKDIIGGFDLSRGTEPSGEPVPVLSYAEAIQAIKECPTMKSCNWLTGQAAVAVLEKAKKQGPKATVMVVPGIGVC